MASKKRKYRQKPEFDTFDELDYLYDDDLDLADIAKDFYSTDWNKYADSEGRISARRQIERNKDMRKLYSELDEWEQFGAWDAR